MLLLIEWFLFWLVAKDVLRLNSTRIFLDDSPGPVKKDALPAESLVKLGMLKGESTINYTPSK